MAVIAIHPGEHLAEELEALRMSAAALARNLAVPTNRITQILNGRRGITGDTALRLAHFFGTSPEFWLNLQSLYELRVAERKAGKAIRSLPKRRQPAPGSEFKFGIPALAHATSAGKRQSDTRFSGAQGKVDSRGARRTR